MKYRTYIIEHKTYGVFIDADHRSDLIYKPRFSWTKPKKDGLFFYTRRAAEMEIEKWPERTAKNCTVTEYRR